MIHVPTDFKIICPTMKSYQRRSPAKANNGSWTVSKSLYIVLAIAIGAVGLLVFDYQQANNFKTSLRKSAAASADNDNNNIGLVSSSGEEKDTLLLRTPEEVGGAVGSNGNTDDAEELQLPAEVETTMGASDIFSFRAIFSVPI